MHLATPILLILSFFAAGLLKLGFGMGAGALLTPILAAFSGPRQAIAVMTPVVLVTDVFVLIWYWRRWAVRYVVALLPWSLGGLTLALVFLRNASSSGIQIAVAVSAIVAALIQLLGNAGDANRRFASHIPLPAVGLVGGIIGTVAHAGGIVFGLYLLEAGLTRERFVASLGLVLFVSDVIKAGAFWQTGLMRGGDVLLAAQGLPVMILGGVGGVLLATRISEKGFRAAVSSLIFLSGVVLLVRG